MRLGLGPLLVALVASVPTRAFVCTRSFADGPSLSWQGRDVTLRPSDRVGRDVSTGALAEAVAFASAQWSAEACSDLQLNVGAVTGERRVGFDWRAGSDGEENQNIIVFRGGREVSEADAWFHPLGAIAITTVTYVRSTGRILDADIELNDSNFSFSSCEPDESGCVVTHDLKNTLTHELGHVLGLDHPPASQVGAEEATMFASARAGDLGKRTLAPDDVAGLCTLYPAEQENGECYGVERPTPTNLRVVEAGCHAVPRSVFPVVAVLGVAFRARRRRSSPYT